MAQLMPFDISEPFASAQRFDVIEQQRKAQEDERKRLQSLYGIQSEISQDLAAGTFDPAYSQALQQMAAIDPEGVANRIAAFRAIGQERTRGMFEDAQKGLAMAKSGQFDQLFNFALKRRERVIKAGGDTVETDSLIAAMMQGQDPTPLLQNYVDVGIRSGLLGAKKEGKSYESLAFTDRVTELRDELAAATDIRQKERIQTQIDDLLRSKPRTAEEEFGLSERKLKAERLASELETRRKVAGENVVAIEKQSFDIRNNLRQAFQALPSAATGYSAPIKEFAAKIFPQIDVENEGKVRQALTNFGLSALQNFKGPTTDFEFNVAQSLAGKIEDPQTSINSKLKALDIATFLSERRAEQLNSLLDDADGDPRKFKFSGAQKYRGYSINEITDEAIKNNLTIDEALRKLQGGNQELIEVDF